MKEPHQDRVPGREADRSPSCALKKHGILSLRPFRCRNRGYTLSFCGTLWSRTHYDPGSDSGTPTARWRRGQCSGPCAGVSGRQVPGSWGNEAGPQGQLLLSLSDNQKPPSILFRISVSLQDGGKEGVGVRILTWDKTEVGAKAGTKRTGKDVEHHASQARPRPFYVCKIIRGSKTNNSPGENWGMRSQILPTN